MKRTWFPVAALLVGLYFVCIACDLRKGIEFTIPEGWSEGPASEEQVNNGVMLYADKNPEARISFEWTDIWDQVPRTMRIWKKRSDFSGDVFGIDFLVEELGVDPSQVFEISVGDQEYVQINIFANDPNDNFDTESPITILYRWENAVLYTFRFFGTEEDEYYPDFLELVASVKYPEKRYDDSLREGELYMVILVGLMVLAVLHARKQVRLQAAQKESGAGEAPAAEETKVCRVCGHELSDQDEFCSECGTEVEPEQQETEQETEKD